jgi:histidinol-phosphatase (PHP family)
MSHIPPSTSARYGYSAEVYDISRLTLLQIFLSIGGRFTLSDDAHAIEQVGLNYAKVFKAIAAAGIIELSFLKKDLSQEAGVSIASVAVAELQTHSLFAS